MIITKITITDQIKEETKITITGQINKITMKRPRN